MCINKNVLQKHSCGTDSLREMTLINKLNALKKQNQSSNKKNPKNEKKENEVEM